MRKNFCVYELLKSWIEVAAVDNAIRLDAKCINRTGGISSAVVESPNKA